MSDKPPEVFAMVSDENIRLMKFMRYLESDHCLMDTFIDFESNFEQACSLADEVVKAISQYIRPHDRIERAIPEPGTLIEGAGIDDPTWRSTGDRQSDADALNERFKERGGDATESEADSKQATD